MAKKALVWILMVLLCLSVLSTTVSAIGTMARITCSIITQVYNAIRAIGPALVTLMFMYGGAKYAFSADDPGGRKQGKMICIHSVVGGILLLLISWLYTGALAKMAICPGITVPVV